MPAFTTGSTSTWGNSSVGRSRGSWARWIGLVVPWWRCDEFVKGEAYDHARDDKDVAAGRRITHGHYVQRLDFTAPARAAHGRVDRRGSVSRHTPCWKHGAADGNDQRFGGERAHGACGDVGEQQPGRGDGIGDGGGDRRGRRVSHDHCHGGRGERDRSGHGGRAARRPRGGGGRGGGGRAGWRDRAA